MGWKQSKILLISLTVLDRDKTRIFIFFHPAFLLWSFLVLAFSSVRCLWGKKKKKKCTHNAVQCNCGCKCLLSIITVYVVHLCVHVQSTKSEVYTHKSLHLLTRRMTEEKNRDKNKTLSQRGNKKNKKTNFEGGFDSLRQLQGDWHRWNMNEHRV